MGVNLSGLLNATTQAAGNYQNAQARAGQQQIAGILQALAMKRQEDKDALAAAVAQSSIKKNAAETALASARANQTTSPTHKLTPHNFTLDGQPTLGFADDAGNLFDATHQPVRGKVTPYTTPTTKTAAEIPGTNEWKDAERFKASLHPNEDRTLVPVQQGDGSILYTPRPQAAGQQAPRPNNTGAASLRKNIADNESQLKIIDDAVSEIDKHPAAVGTNRGLGDFVPLTGNFADNVNQRMDPGGVNARASLANISSMVIKDRSGAAVTASEFPRLAPFIPRISDSPAVAKQKLAKLKEAISRENDAIMAQMGGASAAIPTAPTHRTGERDPGGDIDLSDHGASASPSNAGGKDYGIFGKGANDSRRSLPRSHSRVP